MANTWLLVTGTWLTVGVWQVGVWVWSWRLEKERKRLVARVVELENLRSVVTAFVAARTGHQFQTDTGIWLTDLALQEIGFCLDELAELKALCALPDGWSIEQRDGSLVACYHGVETASLSRVRHDYYGTPAYGWEHHGSAPAPVAISLLMRAQTGDRQSAAGLRPGNEESSP